MKSFKEAYREAVESISVPDFLTEEISEESQKKRVLPYRRKRYMAAAALAGGIFVIYTLGGVAATNYARSLVRVDDNGFQTMDMNTALLQQEMQDSQITEEGGTEIAAGGAEDADSGIMNLAEKEECMSDGAAGRMLGTEESAANAAGEAAEDVIEQEKSQSQNAISDCADDKKIYTSFEEFKEEHDIPLARPAQGLKGELIREEYIVMGNSYLLVRLETDESTLLLHQSYYGDTEGHASATAYAGGVSNERIYTTLQGFAYKLADTTDEKETHAAVAVGDYEMIIDFFGYSEQEIYEVLENMDLTVYL